MSNKVRISVLVSGGGSNLQSIIDHIESGYLDHARIVQVISSNAGAFGLERARKAGIPAFSITKEGWPDEKERNRALLKVLQEADTDLIVLAGYMSILDPSLIAAYRNRIINIHPSLIPKHCGKGYFGKGVHRSVLEAGEKESGATVHLVDEGVDTGRILLQEKVSVEAGDTVDMLAARVLTVEHRILPQAIKQFTNMIYEQRNKGGTEMRALISVSDKTGIVEFAQGLERLGVKIISTGGTATRLRDNGVDVTGISEVTGFPECLDGRVKTLHPAVHGGILAMRENRSHMKQLEDMNIEAIDIVAINLYPFKETILRPSFTPADAIENIDIGGPTMLRSAAKNHRDVVVVCDPGDYAKVIRELEDTKEVSSDTRYRLALKVFQYTAAYDAMIAEYLRKQIGAELPDNLTLTFEKTQELRYGENPHQKAYYYKEVKAWEGALVNAIQLHGKELSFNNINDANGALETLKEFQEPAVVAVKHANPCGVGVGYDLFDAYTKAYKADPVSIFGGIVAMNRTVDELTAAEINKIFIEIVIAPDYTEEALALLTEKKNIRLLKLENILEKAPADALDMKKVSGGLLIQELDYKPCEEEAINVVTDRLPTERELEDMKFAMKVAKHIKSNGIVLAREGKTIGIGPGQVNRIWAVENAIRQATEPTEGAVLASDAFFPFDDCVTAAAKAGIAAIIQPGGSVGDEASIKKANELGIAMVFTGVRHFKH